MNFELSILIAALVGSPHCIAMCGPFVACGMGGQQAGRGWVLQARYQAGRLASYAVVGLIAGGAGAAIDGGAALVGIQRAAILVGTIGLILFGIVSLFSLKPPSALRHWGGSYRRLFGLVAKTPPAMRATLFGALSALLPCGWLYAFAFAAAATGSVLDGFFVMLAFWAGTLPALALAGFGLRLLDDRLRRRLPAVAALALIAIGVGGLVTRAQIPQPTVEAAVEAAESPLEATPSCH